MKERLVNNAMASKFMRVKKIVIPVLTAIIMASQLAGCAVMKPDDLVLAINAGKSIVIEVAKPAYDTSIRGEKEQLLSWSQLDQLKTYSLGFRQGFDTLLNITVVTENNVHGKSGCLFVDEMGDRNGNTTLEDALRNKVFITKYWKSESFKDKLASLASEAYDDVGASLTSGVTGAINAYYNLLPDRESPNSFNPTQSLTRAEFYALVFRSEEGVQVIEEDETFLGVVGSSEYTRYAQGIEEYGFLRVWNGSLDQSAFNRSITRLEAVYLVVNKHFPEVLLNVKGNEKAFDDVSNGKNLAAKIGFKEKNKEAGLVEGKERWQAYTLAFMLREGDGRLQEELYRALIVARQLGLIEGPDSRWDEPISKSEAIQLIINTHLAKNELYGYLTEVEHGKMNLNKFAVASDNLFEVIGITEDGREYGVGWVEAHPWEIPVDPNKMLESGYTVYEVKRMINDSLDRVKDAGITMSDKEKREFAEGVATDLGTTLEEIASCPDIEEEKPKKPVATEQPLPPVKESSQGTGQGTPSQGSTKPLVLETDKWHTKEYKKAARQIAIERGELEFFEERARAWESLPDWGKDMQGSIYGHYNTVQPDLSKAKDTFR